MNFNPDRPDLYVGALFQRTGNGLYKDHIFLLTRYSTAGNTTKYVLIDLEDGTNWSDDASPWGIYFPQDWKLLKDAMYVVNSNCKAFAEELNLDNEQEII